ncbi:MAG: hypothetical protein HS119_08975 [Flavobacteriales bacterium]|nr:hypothetical protein [Flavobacteriales bacterium]
MKNSLLLVLIIIPILLTAQAKIKGERITWSKERMLTSEDFKAKAQKGHKAAAQADVSIESEIINQTENGVKLKIIALFNTAYSWMKPEGKENEHLLKHEQGHFDIFEIFTRRCRKELKEAKLNNKNVAKKLPEIIQKYIQQAYKYQDKYDEQTQHSLKVEKQEEWNKKIAAELEELEAYSNPVIEITY